MKSFQMNYPSLQCPICMNMYDLVTYLPRIIPACGHTICEVCLQKSLNLKQFKCPLDKREFSSLSIGSFPYNFALKALIEESKESDACQFHVDEKIKFVCLTDKLKVCASCAIMKHRDHELKPIADIKADRTAKEKELDAQSEEMEKYFRNTMQALNSQEFNLLKQIKDTFKWVLSYYELLLFTVESCYTVEKQKLNAELEKWNDMKKKAKENIESLKSDLFSDTKSLDSVFEELHKAPKNPLHEQDYLNKFRIQITDGLGMLQNVLQKQEISLKEFDQFINPFQNYFDKLDKPLCIKRFQTPWNQKPWRVAKHRIDGIAFEVSKNIWVYGFGVYPNKETGGVLGEGKLYRGDNTSSEVIWSSMVDLKRNLEGHSGQPLMVLFDRPYLMKKGDCFSVTFAFSLEGETCQGEDGLEKMNGEGDVMFVFKECKGTNNDTTPKVGQIPSIYYYIQN